MAVQSFLSSRNFLYKVMILMFVGAVGASFFSQLPGQTEVAIVFNILMALPVIVALFIAWGWSRALGGVFFLSLFAYFIESLGVLTGWPYGEFQYGSSLGPKLFDIVPLLLPFSYVPVVIGSLAIIPLHFPRWLKVLLGMLLLVGYDLVLDPGAVKLGYWDWSDAGVYYGIPWSNYFGWILSGTIAMIIAVAFEPYTQCAQRSPLLLATYFWGVGFWTFVALLHAMWLPMIVGIGLIALSFLRAEFFFNRRVATRKPEGLAKENGYLGFEKATK